MANVTLQIIEGMEAGRIFTDLSTPITIGREDENHIQLNDERISRFHAKIQEEGGRLILTDCQSTNGTRVNGHPVQMRTLLPGDQVSVGRCTLVVGGVPANGASSDDVALIDNGTESRVAATIDTESEILPAYPAGPPNLPEAMTAVQAAELSDILEYMRTEMLAVIREMQATEDEAQHVRLPREAWHNLQQLPAQISRYLKEICDPPTA